MTLHQQEHRFPHGLRAGGATQAWQTVAWSFKDTAGGCGTALCVTGLGTQQHSPGTESDGRQMAFLARAVTLSGCH